jgi:hypothetical protein
MKTKEKICKHNFRLVSKKRNCLDEVSGMLMFCRKCGKVVLTTIEGEYINSFTE